MRHGCAIGSDNTSDEAGFAIVWQGAFYVFPIVSSFYGKSTPSGVMISDSSSLCMELLAEEKVAPLDPKHENLPSKTGN